MKTLLLLITFFAFLQSAFLPVNLILVAIIARSMVLEDKSNYFLAFMAGLILSFLTLVNLGYYPLIFIIAVKSISLLKKLPVSFSPLMIFLYGSLVIAGIAMVNDFFIGVQIKIYPQLVEAILVLPAYYLVKIWEERFIIKPQIKLKV